MKQKTTSEWRQIESTLARLEGSELLPVLRDMFESSFESRMFLLARFGGRRAVHARYLRLVEDAIFPPPLSKKPVQSAKARQLTQQYARAAPQSADVVDVLLAGIAAGVEQSVDLGFGEEGYFRDLLAMYTEAVDRICSMVQGPERLTLSSRAVAVAERAAGLGWGFGDAMGDIAFRFRRKTRSAASLGRRTTR